MMNSITVALLLCGFPVLWIMVGVFVSSAKLKKGKSFGLAIPDTATEEEEVSAIVTRCRKALLWCGVILTVLILPVLLIEESALAFTYWMFWFVPVIIAPIVLYGRGFQFLKRLKMVNGWEISEDESHWYGGILYYDKKNPKVSVSLRPGVNSINLAHLSGKIVMGLCVLCILAMPFFGVLMMKTDRAETVVTSSETEVTVSHGKTEYTVAYDDVWEVALLREMPQNSRVSGYASERRLKGTFTVAGYGKCSICIDLDDEAILALETDEDTFLFSFDSEAEALDMIGKINIE